MPGSKDDNWLNQEIERAKKRMSQLPRRARMDITKTPAEDLRLVGVHRDFSYPQIMQSNVKILEVAFNEMEREFFASIKEGAEPDIRIRLSIDGIVHKKDVVVKDDPS